MKFEEKIENHFPTIVMQRQFDDIDKMNARLAKIISSHQAQYGKTTMDASLSDKITTEGGFQTATSVNVFDEQDKAIERLKSKIVEPAVKTYLKSAFNSVNIKYQIVGWGNVLSGASWQRPHYHPTVNNLISGVYYVKSPSKLSPPQGALEFINPIPISVHHGYSNSVRVNPAEGMLVLFPPYYMHFVHPIFDSKEDRIVIAFDVIGHQKSEFIT
jgi:uncharacterized protein (TIGR02466 family)